MRTNSFNGRFFRFLLILSLWLLSACTAVKYGLYDTALKSEHWKAGLSEKKLDWNGKTISYLENNKDGKKQTIVLIHGFAANKENWVRFAAHLDSGYHVVIPDLPGHGESVKDFNLKYAYSDQVKYLHEILGRLKIEKFHMAGNSMGGAISCLYAAAYPDQVKSLLLIDPAGIHRYECELTQMIKEGKNPLIVTCPDDFEKLMDFALEKKPYIPWPISTVLAEKAVENQEINKKMFSDMHERRGFEFEDAIQTIKAPTLIVWGDQDRIISIKNATLFEQLIPGSKKIVFEGVGHAPMIELPEKSANLYLDFLAFM
ncbi:MAG: alpha/beta hydrolase [Desulfobacterales bacterium]|jgi:pimeloyl-ACP methyl ester carboxylesterase|nr:alpha/beta hydrolase [Desulfobacterales bacterium]